MPGDMYHQIRLRDSQNWQHGNVQFCGLCRQMPWSTMVVSRYGKRWIGHVALYVPQLCVTLFVDSLLPRNELTQICSHAVCDSSGFWYCVLFPNVCPGSYCRWLQLQRCSGLTGVCVAAVSCRVAHCLKRLSFGSIRLQSHQVDVFLEPSRAVAEWWGRWSRKEVGSPEDYIASYKSKWNEWQPSYTFNSSWIRLRIAALRIAAGHSNDHAISSK